MWTFFVAPIINIPYEALSLVHFQIGIQAPKQQFWRAFSRLFVNSVQKDLAKFQKSFSQKTNENNEVLTIRSGYHSKGRIKPKADWCAIDSPKKQRNGFVVFAFFAFHRKNKTYSFVQFLGESTAHPNCFWFYLTFIKVKLFCSFFGIIEDTKKFFRNKMTFTSLISW